MEHIERCVSLLLFIFTPTEKPLTLLLFARVVYVEKKGI